MTEWIKMADAEPLQEDREIFFISKTGISDERIGIAIPEQRAVILRRTDISYDQISHWFYLPFEPEECGIKENIYQ